MVLTEVHDVRLVDVYEELEGMTDNEHENDAHQDRGHVEIPEQVKVRVRKFELSSYCISVEIDDCFSVLTKTSPPQAYALIIATYTLWRLNGSSNNLLKVKLSSICWMFDHLCNGHNRKVLCDICFTGWAYCKCTHKMWSIYGGQGSQTVFPDFAGTLKCQRKKGKDFPPLWHFRSKRI